MSDRPIIFSGPMIHALLDGRKIQTRRVLKPQPPADLGLVGIYAPKLTAVFGYITPDADCKIALRYVPGDRLWVREQILQSLSGCTLPCGEWQSHWTGEKVEYAADGAKERRLHPERMYSPWMKKRPPIHMPRKYSRLTLIVTDVRVQRVQEISEADAIAEGMAIPRRLSCGAMDRDPRDDFCELWDSLNAARGYGWESNPWVVALTFNVIKANIDSLQDAEALSEEFQLTGRAYVL